MSRKIILIISSLVTVLSLAFASYAYLQTRVASEEAQQFERQSNALQEEVLRLQEVAIQSQAAAMQAEQEAKKWRDEAISLQSLVSNCN